MAVLLEEMMKSLELWIGLIKKTQTIIDPALDPVLLVPGIAGSILNAVNHKTGSSERIWVRIFGADHEFCDKLWSRFDPSTGQAVNLDPDTSIEVPEDRYGLYAIDSLDPDMIIGCDSVYYFHDMIVEMLKWGYQEGTSLFGFGYDFRQSNRFHETLERLAVKLESVYAASGGKKINIISHSMGGLLVKCFMTLRSNIFEKYVKNWIAIASPFQGAPGYITSTFFNGMSFLEGWEQQFFISKWSMHQLLIECPSIYELMGAPDFNWEHIPLLEVWRERCNSDGDSSVILESYPPIQTVSILKEALENNKVTYGGVDVSLPFNIDILNWANETRNVLNRAKMPSQVKFFNIYGTGYDTPHSVSYGSEDKPVSDLKQLPFLTPKYIYVDGDGTVPTESAKADGLNAEARVGVPGDHRGILCDRHVFRIVKHWLKADHDPFYNPVNDYVILPTLFDHLESGLPMASLKDDEWEIVPEDETDAVADDEKIAAVGPVCVHSTLDSCRAELINAVSVSTNA